nr:MAG TPA: hypothetical protein [Caudoviricetes sp.]
MGKFKLQAVDTTIFEKALNNKLLLRCEKGDFNKDYYCIAKTSDGDYILEERKNASIIEKLSTFVAGVRWRIVDPKLPKAFIPKDGDVFWFIHPTEQKKVQSATFDIGNVFYKGMTDIGLAFRTEEDARDALAFLLNNVGD